MSLDTKLKVPWMDITTGHPNTQYQNVLQLNYDSLLTKNTNKVSPSLVWEYRHLQTESGAITCK